MTTGKAVIIKTSKAIEKGFKKKKEAVVAFYSVNEAEEHFGYPHLSRPGRSGNANGHSLWKDTNSDRQFTRKARFPENCSPASLVGLHGGNGQSRALLKSP